jgi:hypothetical protein
MAKDIEKQKIVISIQGGGLSYKGEIDQDIAARIISLCLSKERHIGFGALELKKSITDRGDSYEAIAEYFDQINPKRNPDKILTIAGYLFKKGQKFFTTQDIKPYFSKVGEPIPGNFTRDFQWVKFAKWIAEGDGVERGRFYITKKGQKVLQEGFPKELVEETRGKANKSRFRRKKIVKK